MFVLINVIKKNDMKLSILLFVRSKSEMINFTFVTDLVWECHCAEKKIYVLKVYPTAAVGGRLNRSTTIFNVKNVNKQVRSVLR